MDIYSRFVTGYSVSKTMMTDDTTIPALRMSYRIRSFNKGTIIHSDGGGQFYDNEWKSLTRKGELRNSMCEDVYGNAHAERLNGILKNDYIVEYGPETFEELVKMTGEAVLAYNYSRPHSSLGNIPPAAFERMHQGTQFKNALSVDNSDELPTFNALRRQL
jgi:transposase InsO family protein